VRRAKPLRPAPGSGSSTQQAHTSRRPSLSFDVTPGALPNDVFHASRLPFDPGSPTVRCALCDGRRPTWRSFGARSSVADRKKRMLKRMQIAHG